MARANPIRFTLPLLLCASPVLVMAQAAPPQHNKPSAAAIPANSVATAPAPAAPLTPAQQSARRAEVTFSQGKLEVTANNSSLNQILREISQETGVKITGGVAEERVFGKYGPSTVSAVLASLLDGTESNMLLTPSDANSPGELILTPRHGGPTPPNPNATTFDDDTPTADDAAPPEPRPIQPQLAQPQPQPAPPGSLPNGAGAANNGQTQPAGNANPTDPNAVKTPQQIFEQLQRMQQQSQQK